MRLAGVDLAWKIENNRTVVAFGCLREGRLRVTGIVDDLRSVEGVLECLGAGGRLDGVAIDAPLIITNEDGQRGCEKAIAREYGSRKASCHPSSRQRYPGAASVALADGLSGRGYVHLGARSGKWQLECYPHPAIIEMFGLPERLRYKRVSREQRQEGQIALARMITGLAESRLLPLELPAQLGHRLSRSFIRMQRGRALDRSEDVLDAMICLYIAGLYAIGTDAGVFGDTRDGYIYVPQQRCV